MKNNAAFIMRLKKIVWADKRERQVIEQSGIKISPCNFYSNIPSIDEIENSYEYSADAEISPPYIDCDIFSDSESCRDLLQQLTIISEEFRPPEEGDESSPAGFFWKNSQFGYADAMSYYAFIRHIKPATIIEIGAGFSTLVATEAVGKNESGRIVCIEPFPRAFLEQSRQVELIKRPAQELTAQWLNDNLSDGDILFIDSTHTVKAGSDCLHIYLRLLPHIKRNIYVHVHDIFLPFGMPKHWLLDQHIYWTEQYLLMALLLDNPKMSFLYGSNYHQWANAEILKSFMHGRALAGGSSFWFRYSGGANE